MATKFYTIESRVLNVIGVGAHDFYVLRDETGKVLAQLHGLATSPANVIKDVGTIGDKLKFYQFVPGAIPTPLDPYAGRNYIQAGQISQIVWKGTSDEVLARWDKAVVAIPYLNSLNVPYTPFAVFSFIPVNSNSAYQAFGELMDIPSPNNIFLEPGYGNFDEFLTPEKLETLRYHAPITGLPTSQFLLAINPNFASTQTTPTDPTQSISSNNTLLSGGGYNVTGVGNVNLASNITAFLNNSITGNFRPGADQLAPVAPLQSLTQTISQFLSKPFSNALNNATTGFNNYTPTDPLILDLNGDGVKLTDYGSNPVLFDIDHDGGTLEQTGWVSAQDGLVVYDLNSNGKIDGISETLSEYFNGAAGTGGNAGQKKFSDGVAALKSLDSNGDNLFTSADAAWANVKIWVDDNHDGKSWKDTNNNGIRDTGEATELKTLAALGITSINLNSTAQSGLVRDGNEVLATSTFIQNGQTKEALAANFIADPNGSTFTASGSGTLTQTEGSIKSYSAGNGGEIINVALKAVNNAIGGNGNDTLIGDAGNNWLAGTAANEAMWRVAALKNQGNVTLQDLTLCPFHYINIIYGESTCQS